MAVTVTIDSSVLLLGETVQVAVTITGLEKGLSGFDLTLAIDPGVTVSNIIFPQYGLTALPPENTATSVRLRAVDLNRLIEGVSGPFELFTFDLVGHTVGNWSISILPTALDDDDGSDLLPLTTFVNGAYRVRREDMSDMHVLTGNGRDFRVVMHFPAVVGTNSAGVTWADALANSGIGGKTVLVDGNGQNGTILAAEKNQIENGAIFEHVEDFPILSGGSSAIEVTAALREFYAITRPGVEGVYQNKLSLFGLTESAV